MTYVKAFYKMGLQNYQHSNLTSAKPIKSVGFYQHSNATSAKPTRTVGFSTLPCESGGVVALYQAKARQGEADPAHTSTHIPAHAGAYTRVGSWNKGAGAGKGAGKRELAAAIKAVALRSWGAYRQLQIMLLLIRRSAAAWWVGGGGGSPYAAAFCAHDTHSRMHAAAMQPEC